MARFRWRVRTGAPNNIMFRIFYFLCMVSMHGDSFDSSRRNRNGQCSFFLNMILQYNKCTFCNGTSKFVPRQQACESVRVVYFTGMD
jgi:hypothetical protein